MTLESNLKVTDSLGDLLEVQRASFKSFLEVGLPEELNNFSPVRDYTGRLELFFMGSNYRFKLPKISSDEAKLSNATYSLQLYVPVRLVDKDTGEVKETEVFLGDLPLMTCHGTFIINGAERVIVNQIVRSPGIYYRRELDRKGKQTYNVSIISNRGAWLKMETDRNDLIWVKIDKTKKIPAHAFLKAIGLRDNEILNGLQHPEYLKKTFQREGYFTEEESLIEIYKKFRPGEPATVMGGQQLLFSRFFDPKRYDLGKVGRYKLNKKLGLSIPLDVNILTPQDILAALDYLINLGFDTGSLDDIDHLGNRRIRSVGESLQNQLKVGLNRLERLVRERMSIYDTEFLSPATLVNPKPFIASLKEFFGSSQLSQFMDQTNPLAEITHKRRISALGPGGLNRDRAGFAVRDIHPSHYGRICPIETPEGPNAGLIGSLASHARINSFGFIETPFYKVIEGEIAYSCGLFYLTADEEDNYNIAPGDVASAQNRSILGNKIPVRYRQEFSYVKKEEIDFVATSSIHILSIATSLIPFLEHDDANRALMGSNMQRQAVPLLFPERPIVGTGLEAQVAADSGMLLLSHSNGFVSFVDGSVIRVLNANNQNVHYFLKKYYRSNQDTAINQRPIVWLGEKVSSGQILADGASTENGELALGKNVIIAYLPWNGYNYEDAFLISERLVYDNVFTSVHIEKYEVEARQTKLGPEEITRDVPNVSDFNLRQLDLNGIILKGSWVTSGSILVGKVTPRGDSDQPPEGKLLRAIFGEKVRDIRDSSLRLSVGEEGRIIDVRLFTNKQNEDIPSGTNIIIRIFIAQNRKIQVGDKMAGRHGNKGIISRILLSQDMPYLPDGTPVDIVLNPLGVPSRMNVGQIFECLLGLAGNILDKRFKVLPFDEMYGMNASRNLINNKLQEAATLNQKHTWLFKPQNPGKITLFDGLTSHAFHNPITVGWAYMLKLVHLVDDKMHARSTGPYSLVTQQPLGGKAQQGGQRLGEMEVWALEAFGAAYTLQELLTIKSDDMQGRNEALNAIVKGKVIPKPGIPESFRVLIRELQSLALDIGIYKAVIKSDGNFEFNEVNLMTTSTLVADLPLPNYESLSQGLLLPKELDI